LFFWREFKIVLFNVGYFCIFNVVDIFIYSGVEVCKKSNDEDDSKRSNYGLFEIFLGNILRKVKPRKNNSKLDSIVN